MSLGRAGPRPLQLPQGPQGPPMVTWPCGASFRQKALEWSSAGSGLRVTLASLNPSLPWGREPVLPSQNCTQHWDGSLATWANVPWPSWQESQMASWTGEARGPWGDSLGLSSVAVTWLWVKGSVLQTPGQRGNWGLAFWEGTREKTHQSWAGEIKARTAGPAGGWGEVAE